MTEPTCGCGRASKTSPAGNVFCTGCSNLTGRCLCDVVPTERTASEHEADEREDSQR